MKNCLCLLFFCFIILPVSVAQELPEGYLLQYQQNFSSAKSLADFDVKNPDSWGIFKQAGNYYLQYSGLKDRLFISNLPENIAILTDRIFGDFILEADIRPDLDSAGVGEICLILGMKDQSQYYCIQLTNATDTMSHGIIVLKKSIPRQLDATANRPITWKAGRWQKIRLERNIVKRTIVVYIDNMEQPIMQARDYELVMGSVGFGSFSGGGQIDNIKIWAPTMIRGGDEELK